MQSAVSSNWKPMERGESPLPVHFALINRRDGFFLAARSRAASFAWKDLEGKTLLADHGGQPLAMLRYALHYNGVDWAKIHVLDRGTPEEMVDAFRRGEGDYVHLQAPGRRLLEEEGAGFDSGLGGIFDARSRVQHAVLLAPVSGFDGIRRFLRGLPTIARVGPHRTGRRSGGD